MKVNQEFEEACLISQFNINEILDIPESVLNEHLIPKDYYKPKIEIRNYYLKWNDESYGISQKEIPELKRFVTNAIPFFDMTSHL
jgi:hypothetical protein